MRVAKNDTRMSVRLTTRKTGNGSGNRLIDICVGVHGRDEHGFKLTAGQIHASIEHSMKPTRESCGVRRRRRVQVRDCV